MRVRTFHYYSIICIFLPIYIPTVNAHCARPSPVVILLNAIFYRKRTLRSDCSKSNNRLFIKH